MTRYRLIRLVQLSAAALGLLILGAGIRNLGLTNTVRVIAFCVLGGASASAGWHGVALGAARREEQLRAERRHRAPRPDREQRRQAAAEPEPAPAPPVDQTPTAAADPYAEEYAPLDDPGWPGIEPGMWVDEIQGYTHPAGRA